MYFRPAFIITAHWFLNRDQNTVFYLWPCLWKQLWTPLSVKIAVFALLFVFALVEEKAQRFPVFFFTV